MQFTLTTTYNDKVGFLLKSRIINEYRNAYLTLLWAGCQLITQLLLKLSLHFYS